MLSISTTTCAYYNPVTIGVGGGMTSQFASSSCQTVTDASSSSMPLVVNGFTYGEAVISVLLLLSFGVQLYWFLIGSTRGHIIRT